jgi:hypothetical protein
VSSGYDILLWGIYFCDLIFTGLPEIPRLGAEVFGSSFDMAPGGPFTTTVAMHRLGLCVGWVCDFGNDFFSQFILGAAKREGIDSSLFQIHPFPVRRVSAAFSFSHDRGFVSFMDDVEQTSAIPLIEKHRPRCVFLPHLHYGDVYWMFCPRTRGSTPRQSSCTPATASLPRTCLCCGKGKRRASPRKRSPGRKG